MNGCDIFLGILILKKELKIEIGPGGHSALLPVLLKYKTCNLDSRRSVSVPFRHSLLAELKESTGLRHLTKNLGGKIEMPPGRKRSIVRDKVCAISVLSNINTHTLHTRFVEHGVLSENFFNPPLFFYRLAMPGKPS